MRGAASARMLNSSRFAAHRNLTFRVMGGKGGKDGNVDGNATGNLSPDPHTLHEGRGGEASQAVDAGEYAVGKVLHGRWN